MKKNEVFTFTAPDGVKVTAAAVEKLSSDWSDFDDTITVEWLCYSQNRLFTFCEQIGRRNAYTPEEESYLIESWYGRVLVEYCILPDYDAILANHQADVQSV